MTGISRSQASKLCGEIDDRIRSFLDRSPEGDWPLGACAVENIATAQHAHTLLETTYFPRDFLFQGTFARENQLKTLHFLP